MKYIGFYGVTGRFMENPVYHVDENEPREFDKSFSKKEKRVTAS